MTDESWPRLDKSHESAGAGDARSLALAQLHLAAQAVQRYVSSVTPRSLWRDGAALVRREPALALGASFLLGAALARLATARLATQESGKRPPAQRERHEAEGHDLKAHDPEAHDSEAHDPEASPGVSHQSTFDPVAVHQAPSPAEPVYPVAGSPIGDSPGAGGVAS